MSRESTPAFCKKPGNDLKPLPFHFPRGLSRQIVQPGIRAGIVHSNQKSSKNLPFGAKPMIFSRHCPKRYLRNGTISAKNPSSRS